MTETREPTLVTYTRLMILNHAREWMVENFGTPLYLSDADRAAWHLKFGLLCDFLMEAFQE